MCANVNTLNSCFHQTRTLAIEGVARPGIHRPYRHICATSSACSGDEGGDDVGGVPVERPACSVVSHCGSGVGMRCGFLDVSEWYSGVEGGGYETVSKRMG